jgi:hypothetical protein
MAAEEAWMRQVEESGFVGEDQPAAFLVGGPMLARSGACSRAATRSITPSARASCRATTAGTPRFKMPAFSPAISPNVDPRCSVWSMEIGVMTLTAGRSITLVASSRPPRPTSSKSASAGRAANNRNAAAVPISKAVMGSPALTRSQVVSASASASSSTSRPPSGCASRMRSWKRTKLGEV